MTRTVPTDRPGSLRSEKQQLADNFTVHAIPDIGLSSDSKYRLNLKYFQVSRNHMNPPSFFASLRSRQDCMNNAKYKYGSSKGVRIEGIQVIVQHKIIIRNKGSSFM